MDACDAVFLIVTAFPSLRINRGFLVSAMTFSYVYDEGELFNIVTGRLVGDHDTVINPATAVRELAPFLANTTYRIASGICR